MNKTIHHKICAFLTDSPNTLQELLATAIISCEDRIGRKKKIEKDNECVRLMHRISIRKNALTGQLISYYPRTNKNAAALDDDAVDLELTEIAPPEDDEGHRQEFLEGLSWIYIQENSIVIAASMHFSISRIEDYINWILEKYVWTRNPDGKLSNGIVFQDPIAPEEVLNNPRQSTVKSITLKSGISRVSQDNEQRTEAVGGMSLDIIRKLIAANEMGTNDLNDVIKRIDNTGLSEADYEVEIMIRDTRRRISIEGHPTINLLTGLVSAMRNEEPDTCDRFAVTLTDGSIVKGSNFKRVKSVKVQDSNGIPKHHDVLAKMTEWHDNVIMH
jgi:hypothetical protein